MTQQSMKHGRRDLIPAREELNIGPSEAFDAAYDAVVGMMSSTAAIRDFQTALRISDIIGEKGSTDLHTLNFLVQSPLGDAREEEIEALTNSSRIARAVVEVKRVNSILGDDEQGHEEGADYLVERADHLVRQLSVAQFIDDIDMTLKSGDVQEMWALDATREYPYDVLFATVGDPALMQSYTKAVESLDERLVQDVLEIRGSMPTYAQTGLPPSSELEKLYVYAVDALKGPHDAATLLDVCMHMTDTFEKGETPIEVYGANLILASGLQHDDEGMKRLATKEMVSVVDFLRQVTEADEKSVEAGNAVIHAAQEPAALQASIGQYLHFSRKLLSFSETSSADLDALRENGLLYLDVADRAGSPHLTEMVKEMCGRLKEVSKERNKGAALDLGSFPGFGGGFKPGSGTGGMVC